VRQRPAGHRRPSDRLGDPIADRGPGISGEDRHTTTGKRVPVPLQVLEGGQVRVDLLHERIDREAVVPGLTAGGGETENPEVSGEARPPGKLLRTHATMGGGEPDHPSPFPAEPIGALQGEEVRGIRHQLRAPQGGQDSILTRASGDRACAERRHRGELEPFEPLGGREKMAVQLDERALVHARGPHVVVTRPLTEEARGSTPGGPAGHDVEEERPHGRGREPLRQGRERLRAEARRRPRPVRRAHGLLRSTARRRPTRLEEALAAGDRRRLSLTPCSG
jgi:hypothetical protein